MARLFRTSKHFEPKLSVYASLGSSRPKVDLRAELHQAVVNTRDGTNIPKGPVDKSALYLFKRNGTFDNWRYARAVGKTKK